MRGLGFRTRGPLGKGYGQISAQDHGGKIVNSDEEDEEGGPKLGTLLQISFHSATPARHAT